MSRLIVLLTILGACVAAPEAGAATPVRPPARVLVAAAGLPGALPTARIGFGRHYGSGRYGYGRRGYGGGGFGFGRRGHGWLRR